MDTGRRGGGGAEKFGSLRRYAEITLKRGDLPKNVRPMDIFVERFRRNPGSPATPSQGRFCKMGLTNLIL